MTRHKGHKLVIKGGHMGGKKHKGGRKRHHKGGRRKR